MEFGMAGRHGAGGRGALMDELYLRDDHQDGLGWFSGYGPEQTRPLRALRTWATMSHLGRDDLVPLLDETRAAGIRAAEIRP
jgi:hypothetical protein